MSDTILQLANKLRDIHFPDEVGFFDQTFFDRVAANGSRACYPTKSGAWVVKFSLGGKQTSLGWSDSGADAARFADMARVRFSKYRMRGSWKPLTDHDLNFDLAQVRADETEVPEAVALLDDIEHLLLADGILKDYKVVEASRAAVCAARAAKRPKGDEILLRLERIEKLLAQFVALSKTT